MGWIWRGEGGGGVGVRWRGHDSRCRDAWGLRGHHGVGGRGENACLVGQKVRCWVEYFVSAVSRFPCDRCREGVDGKRWLVTRDGTRSRRLILALFQDAAQQVDPWQLVLECWGVQSLGIGAVRLENVGFNRVRLDGVDEGLETASSFSVSLDSWGIEIRIKLTSTGFPCTFYRQEGGYKSQVAGPLLS